MNRLSYRRVLSTACLALAPLVPAWAQQTYQSPPADLVKILEPHGYTARETQRHLLWEYINWLDKYVKNAAPRPVTSATASSQAPK